MAFGEELEFESEYVVLFSMLLFGPYFCGWGVSSKGWRFQWESVPPE